MRRFRFRLSRLERLRDHRRREARVALSRALNEEAMRTDERVSCERRLEWAIAAQTPSSPGADARAWKDLAGWREACRVDLELARAEERQAAEAAREAERAYVEADRELRVLARLRERRHQRWMAEAELEERKFLDEIHLLREARHRTHERSST